MAAATDLPLDLQWEFPGYDIRNSRIARMHWETGEPVDVYRFETSGDPAVQVPLTNVLRLNYVSEIYEVVAVIYWGNVLSESVVQFLSTATQTLASELRRKHPERPNSRSRYFSAGDSHYKWGPGERRSEDLICVQTVPPNNNACFFEGSTNRMRVMPEGQLILDQLIVTLLLNLYMRETNMW